MTDENFPAPLQADGRTVQGTMMDGNEVAQLRDLVAAEGASRDRSEAFLDEYIRVFPCPSRMRLPRAAG